MSKLVDRSGGFWTQVIVNKKPIDLVVRQNLIPDQRAMRVIADEAISSLKGGKMNRLHVSLRGGRLHYRRVPAGQYPYGIAKRISPNGTPYKELSAATLKHRRFKVKEGELAEARGRSFILRETSKHIFHGITLKATSSTSKGIAEARISFVNPALAVKHDKGGSAVSMFFGKRKRAKIPARPFIGFQKAFIQNFHRMMGGRVK